MKIGIATFVTDEGIHPATLGAALEERGFDSLFLAEHSYIPTSRQTPYPGGGDLPRVYYRTLNPFVALTAAAGATSRLLLATGIALVVQRDPLHTAKEVASLDVVSGGRAILGVGAGWNREEMRNHGTDPATRGALLDERLTAIREIWRHDEAEYHGRFVDFERVHAWPRPVQRPHPPIYVGGGGEVAKARAARHGDGWLPIAPDPGQLAGEVTELATQAGRTVPVTVFGAPADREVLARYQEIGVERALLLLPTRPEADTLRRLDELVTLTRGITPG